MTEIDETEDETGPDPMPVPDAHVRLPGAGHHIRAPQHGCGGDMCALGGLIVLALTFPGIIIALPLGYLAGGEVAVIAGALVNAALLYFGSRWLTKRGGVKLAWCVTGLFIVFAIWFMSARR